MDGTNTNLAVYLNNHLAGAVGAIEIVDSMASRADAPELSTFARELRDAVVEDRETLESLMSRAGIAKSTSRRAVAWISEKAAELKTYIDDRSNGALRTFELIEIVAVGVDGKRALWAALATAAETIPQLRSVDYSGLAARADAQRQAIEEQRLQWALAALSRKS